MSDIIRSVANVIVHSRMFQGVSDTSRDFTNGADTELLVSEHPRLSLTHTYSDQSNLLVITQIFSLLYWMNL